MLPVPALTSGYGGLEVKTPLAELMASTMPFELGTSYNLSEAGLEAARVAVTGVRADLLRHLAGFYRDYARQQRSFVC